MIGIDLESLFRTPGQIAVLRALWKAPTVLTGRQVQELAGVHNRTAMTCLADLERLDILLRRTAGRAYLYSLKRTHRIVTDLIDPMFSAEQSAPDQLAMELGKVLAGRCLSAVLYGSVARGTAATRSDVDILVVVRDDAEARRFAESIQDDAERLVRENWGAVLEVNVKTVRQARAMRHTSVVKEIRSEGRLITGKPLAEILHAPKALETIGLTDDRTGADGNRTHQEPRSDPSTALKAAGPTRNPDAPRPNLRRQS